MKKVSRNAGTTTVHVNIPDSILERFDRAFPSCRRRFVQNAMALALSDKIMFDKIFFYGVESFSDSSSVFKSV